jgi:hypothetical protein
VEPGILLSYLEHPASHALTLALGMSLYHFIFARPLREHHEREREQSLRLQKFVDELLELQVEALKRVGRTP